MSEVSTSDGPVLVAEDLACERGGRLLFEGLSFLLEAGSVIVVEGPNGSGKSSLLRVVAGLLAPVKGRVVWRGQDTRRDPQRWRREMVFLGHLNAVKQAMTVRENLAFWQSPARDGTDEVLESLGLARLADFPAAMLSAGQLRRLALARVAACPGGCWLLDEPAAGLDDESLANLDCLIERHRALGGVVVIATHTAWGSGDAPILRMGPQT